MVGGIHWQFARSSTCGNLLFVWLDITSVMCYSQARLEETIIQLQKDNDGHIQKEVIVFSSFFCWISGVFILIILYLLVI